MYRLLAVLTVLASGYDARAQPTFTADQIRLVQEELRARGYVLESVDGVLDRSSEEAIRRYQADWQIPQTGGITQELIDRLTRNHPQTAVRWQRLEGRDCDVRNSKPEARDVVTWSGGCLDGKAHGEGRLVWRYMRNGEPSGSTFEGTLRQGVREGHGVLTWLDDDRHQGRRRYVGHFHRNKFHGHGVLTWPDGRWYKGEFRDGTPSGKGEYIAADGRRYEGEIHDGKPSGRGNVTYLGGDRYEGEFREGAFHGRGRFVTARGLVYEGEFKEGMPEGRGVFTFPDGASYEGEVRDGLPHGTGVFSQPDGSRYEGQFSEGNRHGRGILTMPDGTRYQEEYRNGELQDLGTLVPHG